MAQQAYMTETDNGGSGPEPRGTRLRRLLGRLAERLPASWRGDPRIWRRGAVVAVLALSLALVMRAQWSGALAVVLLGVAAFVAGTPLNMMVMEKASSAPSLASSANQAAFNLANAGGAWIGGLALAAGFGVTSPAVAGAGLAVLGLAVAGVAYGVDARRAAAARPAPNTARERVVAVNTPRRTKAEARR
ncbi:hypothetical protein SAURM35S_08263 [Streptomyces aurantiogriseus]